MRRPARRLFCSTDLSQPGVECTPATVHVRESPPHLSTEGVLSKSLETKIFRFNCFVFIDLGGNFL